MQLVLNVHHDIVVKIHCYIEGVHIAWEGSLQTVESIEEAGQVSLASYTWQLIMHGCYNYMFNNLNLYCCLQSLIMVNNMYLLSWHCKYFKF